MYEVCLIPSAVLDNASDPMNLGISQYELHGLVLVTSVRVDLAPPKMCPKLLQFLSLSHYFQTAWRLSKPPCSLGTVYLLPFWVYVRTYVCMPPHWACLPVGDVPHLCVCVYVCVCATCFTHPLVSCASDWADSRWQAGELGGIQTVGSQTLPRVHQAAAVTEGGLSTVHVLCFCVDGRGGIEWQMFVYGFAARLINCWICLLQKMPWFCLAIRISFLFYCNYGGYPIHFPAGPCCCDRHEASGLERNCPTRLLQHCHNCWWQYVLQSALNDYLPGWY